MIGFILYPIKYFVDFQSLIYALCELFDIACLVFDLCLFAQIISGFDLFDKPQKYLFTNISLKLTYGC